MTCHGVYFVLIGPFGNTAFLTPCGSPGPLLPYHRHHSPHSHMCRTLSAPSNAVVMEAVAGLGLPPAPLLSGASPALPTSPAPAPYPQACSSPFLLSTSVHLALPVFPSRLLLVPADLQDPYTLFPDIADVPPMSSVCGCYLR